MGTDIHGFIECRWDRWPDEDDRAWFQAIDLSHLQNGRDYVAFGSLFGVRDTTSFRALADHRGLPHDVSKEVLADFWKMHGRNSGLTRFAELSGLTDARQLLSAGSVFPENTEWPDGDRLFRVGRLRRKDAVPDSEWGAVWSVMRTLANLHGDEGARLVVRFDG